MHASAARVVWYRFRITLHRRWGGYLALAVLIGVVGGVAMASMNAARRTYASYPAFLASIGFLAQEIPMYRRFSRSRRRVTRLPSSPSSLGCRRCGESPSPSPSTRRFSRRTGKSAPFSSHMYSWSPARMVSIPARTG